MKTRLAWFDGDVALIDADDVPLPWLAVDRLPPTDATAPSPA